jgi:hypothetical protein
VCITTQRDEEKPGEIVNDRVTEQKGIIDQWITEQKGNCE